MSLINYLVDGTALSEEDQKKVSDLVEHTAWLCQTNPKEPGIYHAQWHESVNPNLDIRFPDGCLIVRKS